MSATLAGMTDLDRAAALSRLSLDASQTGHADDVDTPTASYAAELSPDWEIWGPQGGYLAAVALRAAGETCGRARPATMQAHFVGAGRSGPVTIDVWEERVTRAGTSLRVRVAQASERGTRVLLTAMVWGLDADLPGMVHQHAEPPVPAVDGRLSPAGLLSVRERLANRDTPPPHSFWLNVEQRPLEWIDDWEHRPPTAPQQRNWYRFVESETFPDPWLDAGRVLVVLDVDGYGAATRPHPHDATMIAPTIELSVRFTADTRSEAWLLSAAEAPVAANGTVAHSGSVWLCDGRIAAVGGSTLLWRPVPNPAAVATA